MTCATAKAYTVLLPTLPISGLIADPPFSIPAAVMSVFGLVDYYQAPTTGCLWTQGWSTIASPFEDPRQRGRLLLGIVGYMPGSAANLFGADLARLAVAISREPDPGLLVVWLRIAQDVPLVQATLTPILNLAAGQAGMPFAVQAAALAAATAGLSLATGSNAIAWAQRIATAAAHSENEGVRNAASGLQGKLQFLLTSNAPPVLPGAPPVKPPPMPKDPPAKIPDPPGSDFPWWIPAVGAGAVVILGGAWWAARR